MSYNTIKINLKLISCLTIYFIFNGNLFGQDLLSIIDLNRVANLLNFPKSELLITDYLSQEKFIYTKKNTSEENSGRIPPVDPKSIYQSYLITSKTPNAFLPIIITLSKPDAYLTPRVKEIVAGLNLYASNQLTLGGDYPYGDFKLPGASHASMFWEEIRVPAHSKQVIDPGDTWTRLDEYPTTHPANVSIIKDATCEVDVRITQYAYFYFSEKMVKLPGAENYFAAFNEDPEDDPKGYAVFDFLKGLNQIVLTSPMMNPYRKTPIPPIPVPEPPKEESVKPTENPAASQLSSTSLPQPPSSEDSSKNLKMLALILLALATLAAIIFKIRKKRN
jgi:hypothetical protein